MSDRASKAKDKGNELFKDGQLTESVKAYKEAEILDPNNAVYPSNLSAALYELGDYPRCMDAILRSWALKPQDEDFVLKLSTRLAKTLCHGVQDGSISPHVIKQNVDAIKSLEAFKDSAENAAWNTWKDIRPGLEYHAELSHEAKVRLSKMPIFKGTLDPRLTYFVLGTDDIVTLVDDWGPDFRDPINLRNLTNQQLSFLIAGVGDARHAFGTIIALGKAEKKLPTALGEEMKTHLTLLDIHFAIIARNLICFMLLDALLSDNLETKHRTEIEATLIYVYVGWAIPDYCNARLMLTIEQTKVALLSNPPALPPWLHIDRLSIKPALKALNYWLSNKTTTTANFNLKHVSRSETMKEMVKIGAGSPHMPVGNPFEQHRIEAGRAIDRLGSAELRDMVRKFGGLPVNASAAVVKRLAEERKEEIIDAIVVAKLDMNSDWGLDHEVAWFKLVNVFMPPKNLLYKHPGFEYFQEMVTTRTADESKLFKVAKSVHRSWKPNITFLDGTEDEHMKMDFDAFKFIRQIAAFNLQYDIKPSKVNLQAEAPTYAYVSSFFDAVVDTLKSMKGRLTVELICGEVNQELAKVRLGTDCRPGNFPKKFSRIWLSNIPDYTHGTLNTAVYVVPALRTDNNSAATANCLFNSPVWRNDDEFCYNYTLLLPKDLERYLGIRTLKGTAVQELLTLAPSPLPRPLASLASRENFRAWLARLLVSLVCPGRTQVRPNTIKLPNNLVAFISLLSELRNIGYPSHWISDFMHDVLRNALLVDRLAYDAKLPRPVSEFTKRVAAHRVRLDPWHAELEMILALSRHGLPFSLNLPDGFATTPSDVGLYKAFVRPNMLFSSPMFALPPHDAVAALLFYKNASELHPRSVDYFLSTLAAVVDGDTHPPRGSFHVCTSQEFVDLSKREVRWRMSKKLVAKMRREKWSMIVWRMDYYVTTTDPCFANSWVDIDSPV